MTSGLALSVAAFSLAAAGAAPADSELRWSAPSGCPSQQEAQRWVAEAGGRPDLRVDVDIRREADDRWVVEITSPEGAEGTRTIEGESCLAVSRAAVVAVVFAGGMTPPGQDEVREAEPEPRPALESPPPQSREVQPIPSRAAPATSIDVLPRRPSRTPAARLTVGGKVGYGPLPGPAGGISGAVGAEGRWWWVDAGATHWFRRFVGLPRTTGAGAHLSLTTAAAEAGPMFRYRTMAFALGGGAQIGAIRAKPEGAVSTQTKSQLWLALSVKGGVHWRPTTWLSIGVEVAAVAPMLRRRYVLDTQTLHGVKPIGIEGGVVGRFLLRSKTQKPVSSLATRRGPAGGS